jgi:hypothetical protein
MLIVKRLGSAREKCIMTRQTFALWSFQRDLKVGLYDEEGDPQTWDELEQSEKEVYLEEADHYLALPSSEWPDDVIDRMKEEGVEE